MKETFYFSHDYEPTSDPKIQAMIGEYGASGYGLFWRIVEMLHSDSNHKLMKKKYIYLAISKQLLIDVEYVEKFINDCVNIFELFSEDVEYFWSARVNRNFQKREEIKEKRSKAGKKGMEKRWGENDNSLNNKESITSDNNVITNDNKNITKNNKGKERKEKEKKEKESVCEREDEKNLENIKHTHSHTPSGEINNFIFKNAPNIRDKLGYLTEKQTHIYLNKYSKNDIYQIIMEINEHPQCGIKYKDLYVTMNKFFKATQMRK